MVELIEAEWSIYASVRLSALFHIMACRLDGTKPLSEPMLTYCQLDPKEHISMKFYLKFKYFHSTKMHLNMSSAKCRPFCLSLNVLSHRHGSIWYVTQLSNVRAEFKSKTDLTKDTPYLDGILPKGPYPPCLRMADRALLAGYPRSVLCEISCPNQHDPDESIISEYICNSQAINSVQVH